MVRHGVFAVAILMSLGAVATEEARAADFDLQEARAQLAPTGKLRAAFVLSNSALVSQEQANGQVGGLAGDLARAIAEKIGVPLQPRIYLTHRSFEGSLGIGEWDIEIATRVPRHARHVDFSANFALVDQVYLVAPGKTLEDIAEVDRKGVRIATTENSDAETFLFDTIKNAQLLRVTAESEAAVRLLKSGAAEVFGDSAEYLTGIASQLPGTRFLPGRFTTIPAAIGVARGRPSALAFVNQFLRDAKSSGLIKRSIERAHLHGVEVAPP
jgi:polar amino acid transport system substrate-binding protein